MFSSQLDCPLLLFDFFIRSLILLLIYKRCVRLEFENPADVHIKLKVEVEIILELEKLVLFLYPLRIYPFIYKIVSPRIPIIKITCLLIQILLYSILIR